MTSLALPRASTNRALSALECEAIFARARFAHLSFVRRTHPHVTPIRMVFSEGWVYFRADRTLSAAIRRNAWVAITVTECVDDADVASVVALGTCYDADQPGSWVHEAAALRGIVKLRDRTPATAGRRRHIARTLSIYRVRVDELQGIRVG
jgi:nitroimidazol reductase NimA-like FMN-containing flavoprotein (pyridoxamine 5'-phosphate oxidase superfamily)